MLEITLFSLISIHALREEGDSTSIAATTRLGDFYPRPPRGGRQACIFTRTITSLFLSTPSARRATFYRPGRYLPGMISIHALREEGDPSSAVRFWLQKVFLSTPSARRATFKPEQSSVLQGLFLSTPSARRATGGSYLFLG